MNTDGQGTAKGGGGGKGGEGGGGGLAAFFTTPLKLSVCDEKIRRPGVMTSHVSGVFIFSAWTLVEDKSFQEREHLSLC